VDGWSVLSLANGPAQGHGSDLIKKSVVM